MLIYWSRAPKKKDIIMINDDNDDRDDLEDLNNDDDHQDDDHDDDHDDKDDLDDKGDKGDDKDKKPKKDPFKNKLDKAYSERDAIRDERDQLKKQLREKELEALRKDGKEKEAYEAELADKDAEIDALKARIVKLTRDADVNRHLAGYTFRNKRAQELTAANIIDDLRQNDDGEWESPAGESIGEFVKSYLEDEENSFLLKEKINRGRQSKQRDNDDKSDKGSKPRSNKRGLRGLTQKEVMERAAKGELPHQKNRAKG